MPRSGRERYLAERARQLNRTGDPQTAGVPGDHRAKAAAWAAPCPRDGCGHSWLLHNLSDSGKRTRCTVGGPGGWCACPGETEGKPR